MTAQDQLSGTFVVSADDDRHASVFGFDDSTRTGSLDAAVNWSRRFSQFLIAPPPLPVHAADDRRRAVLRQPHERVRRSRHHRQQPGSGELGTADAASSQRHRRRSATRSSAPSTTRRMAAAPMLAWSRGRHYITFGGGTRRQQLRHASASRTRAARSRSRASTTGSDLADFLLGIPHSSSIAFGNADKFLRGSVARGLRQRRLAVSPALDAQYRRAMGVRIADHREARPAREPGRRAGLRRGRRRSSPATRWARSRARTIQPRSCAPTSAAFSRASASRGGRLPDRRWSSAPATASIATRTSTSRSRWLMAQQPPLSKAVNVGELARDAAHAGQRVHPSRRRARRTRLPSIRTSASGSRRTGRCPRSATCRRR